MIVAVLGSPTALTHAGFAIVQAIAESTGDPHQQIPAVLVDDLQNALAELPDNKREQVVIVSDLPSTPLLDIMRASGAPAVIFLDDFEEIVKQLVETGAMELRPAVRHTTQVLCAIDQVRGDNVLRVRSDDGARPLKAFIESLCEFLGLERTARTAGEVMERLGYAAGDRVTLRDYALMKLPQPVSSEPIIARGDALEQAMLKFVAKQYAQVGSGVGVDRIAWPTDLFFQADPPQDFLEGHSDLVGPARFLSYGPYLHLPKGSWSVNITIEVAENFSGNHLVVDVVAETVLAVGETALPVSGVFGFDLAFEVEDPFVAVEVRSQITSGAIEGKLALREVVFRRK